MLRTEIYQELNKSNEAWLLFEKFNIMHGNASPLDIRWMFNEKHEFRKYLMKLYVVFCKLGMERAIVDPQELNRMRDKYTIPIFEPKSLQNENGGNFNDYGDVYDAVAVKAMELINGGVGEEEESNKPSDGVSFVGHHFQKFNFRKEFMTKPVYVY